MANLLRTLSCSIALVLALVLWSPGVVRADSDQTQTEKTETADAKQANRAQSQDADKSKDENNNTTTADNTPQQTDISVTEVEVNANKYQGPTIGQQKNAEGVNNYVVTHSFTGSKSDVANKDLPQSIAVVGQDIMKEQSNKTVADALANVAGVFLNQQIPNYFYNTSFNIRGFGNGFNPYVYVNGLWDPCITMSGWTGNLDRIEVLKGPASVLYGNGSPGGMIDYITKKPLPYSNYTVGTEFGSWGYKSTDLDMSIPLTIDKRWLSRTIIQDTDDQHFQNNSEFRRFNGSFIIQGKPREDTVYTFEGQFNKATGPSGYGLLPLTGTVNPPYGLVPYNGNYISPHSKETYVGRSVSAEVDHRFNDVWTVRSALRYSGETTQCLYINGSTLNLSTLTLGQTWQQRQMQTDTTSWDTTANAKFKAAGLNHDLTLGFDWSRFTQYIPYMKMGMGLPSVSLYNPDFSNYLPTRIMVGMSNYRSNAYRFGSYISDIEEITPKLKLAEGISFTSQNQLSGAHDSGSAWRVGATYEMSPGVSLFAGYATSYEPQGSKLSGTQTVYFEPETGNQLEGGVKVDISDKASVTLSTYHINRQDTVYAIPGTVPQLYEQIGRQSSRGVDFDASYVIKPGWNLLVAYSHCDARVVQDSTYQTGSVLPNVPLNSFRIWSTYEFQKGSKKGLGFGGGLTYVGSRMVDYNNSLGRMDGYTTIDAVVYYKANDGWRYSLNLYNLTNKQYWALGSTSGVYAGTPRSMTFRIEKSFS